MELGSGTTGTAAPSMEAGRATGTTNGDQPLPGWRPLGQKFGATPETWTDSAGEEAMESTLPGTGLRAPAEAATISGKLCRKFWLTGPHPIVISKPTILRPLSVDYLPPPYLWKSNDHLENYYYLSLKINWMLIARYSDELKTVATETTTYLMRYLIIYL